MSTEFISPDSISINVQRKFISLTSFLGFFALDIALVAIWILIWGFSWLQIKKLKVMDLKLKQEIVLESRDKIYKFLTALFRMLREVGSLRSAVLQAAGFQSFCYLYMIRRLTQVMGILLATDLCVWIPYMYFLQPPENFSLVSMQSEGNAMFRSFYTMWVAIVLLHSLTSMRTYLRRCLHSHLFMVSSSKARLLNAIKANTVCIHFLASIPISKLHLKNKLVQDLKIEASIVAVKKIYNSPKTIEIQYNFKIIKIISEKLQSLSSMWKCIKAKESEDIQKYYHENISMYKESRYKKQNHQRGVEKELNSFFVSFETNEVSKQLCQQFQSKHILNELCGSAEHNSRTGQLSHEVIIQWAQEPNDIMWINLGSDEKTKLMKYILFNLLSILVLIADFILIVLSTSQSLVHLPKVLGPLLLVITNNLLRVLITKAIEWENKIFQSQLQMKQFQMLFIFLLINVVLGSIIRDTLNLFDILQTGWGWLSVIGLLYQQIDGYFYYLFLLNETTLNIFSALVQVGNLVPEVFEIDLTYRKNTEVRHFSKYGRNDAFRFGYNYAADVINLTIILLYSASSPLLHLFGFVYFGCQFVSMGYMLLIFHKRQETASNMRIIDRSCGYIENMIILWIVLTAITMMFDGNYSNVIILYLFLAGIIYWSKIAKEETIIKDTKDISAYNRREIEEAVKEWNQIYCHTYDYKEG